MSPGPAKIDLDELLTAFEFSRMGEAFGNLAFVSLKTGEIFLKSDDLDTGETLPDDLETSDEFLCLPSKKELDLGHNLVFSFIEEQLPDKMGVVQEFFRRRGAYPRFKDMLDSRGMLENWHRYEEERTQAALRRWCDENGLQFAT